MRSVKSVSTLGNGERIVTSVGAGGVAFGFETSEVMTRGTMLANWRNGAAVAAAVFADGSQLSAIQASPPPSPVAGQWWIESVSGSPVLFVRHSGANVAIASPSGTGVAVSSLTAGAGLDVSASSGPVIVSVDFTEVAPAAHTHAYLPLNGSAAMTGQHALIDGSPAAPAAHGSDPDTGLFFGGGLGISVDGATVFKATGTGINVGDYTLPLAIGALGSVVRRGAGGAEWAKVSHGDIIGIGADDHHAQVHAITADHTATPWRTFYSDLNGVITELPLGAANKALFSAGAGAPPVWRDAMPVPSRVAPEVGIGYSFVDSPNSGFTVGPDGVVSLVVGGVVLLGLSAASAKLGPAVSGVSLPVARGTVGQVLVQQAAGVVAFADAATVVPLSASNQSYYRTFLFGG